MSKWSVFTVFLCASLLSSTLFGQWTQASGQYPQSQYPENQPPVPDQQEQQAAENPDPADLQHGVARVSIAQGDVNIRRGDNGQFTGVVVNAPVGLHDHLETGAGSRAEVQLDAVTFLRLAPNTDVGFADLQYHRAQIQLGLGTIIFRVLQASPTQVEIDTPSVGMRALMPGEYRISVFDNGTSQMSVTSGQAEILAPSGTERLNAGRSVMVRGDAATPEMQDVAVNPRDQFDDWSGGRDQEVAASQSTQYVNTDVQGASDLDRYGSWVPSTYGQAWQPQGVASDWSPYSNGQWSYSDYYGWTWIDSSPWGWAPYHYGRWFNNAGYGWCWWPGPRLYPAYYRPALVGFFGLGAGIGIGLGALGWVALAPFERFHPWWGFGGGFGFRGGYGLAGYRNAGFRGGVLSVSINNFAGTRQHFGAATHSQIVSASGISGRLPVTNVRAGMNYASRAAVPNNRFASVQSRSFYNGAGTVTPRTSGIQRSTPAGGWQHFGTPGASTAPRSNFQRSESSGWHSFATPLGSANRSYQTAPRAATPSYQAQPHYNYSAPRSYSQPSYQQPRSNYSSPRQSSQPKSAPAPHSSGGGGGGHSSGGGHSGGSGHHR